MPGTSSVVHCQYHRWRIVEGAVSMRPRVQYVILRLWSSILIIGFAFLTFAISRWFLIGVTGTFIAAVAVGFSMRCPKCRSRLVWQASAFRTVPRMCKVCGEWL